MLQIVYRSSASLTAISAGCWRACKSSKCCVDQNRRCVYSLRRGIYYMVISCFDDVVRFMESFTNLEKQTTHYTTRTYRLDRMKALLAYLGNPELSFRKIHLAGSKGKGSTASYIA
ncbi:MAG: hypothetical protein M0R06_23705, partial [Sphaerochaeta sp.]|nr:hypothetical protein [Sphaerochaeta sp.]